MAKVESLVSAHAGGTGAIPPLSHSLTPSLILPSTRNPSFPPKRSRASDSSMHSMDPWIHPCILRPRPAIPNAQLSSITPHINAPASISAYRIEVLLQTRAILDPGPNHAPNPAFSLVSRALRFHHHHNSRCESLGHTAPAV